MRDIIAALLVILVCSVVALAILIVGAWYDHRKLRQMATETKICPHGILMTEECPHCERRKGGMPS